MATHLRATKGRLQYGMTPCHLPADAGERACLNPTRTRFTYPGGMESWFGLGVCYIPRWFTYSYSSMFLKKLNVKG